MTEKPQGLGAQQVPVNPKKDRQSGDCGLLLCSSGHHQLSPNSLFPLAFGKLQMTFYCLPCILQWILPTQGLLFLRHTMASILGTCPPAYPPSPLTLHFPKHTEQCLVSVQWLNLLPWSIISCGILFSLANPSTFLSPLLSVVAPGKAF